MSTPNRAQNKSAAIRSNASSAKTKVTKGGKTAPVVGSVGNRPVKPNLGKPDRDKNKGPVYEIPAQPKMRTSKK